jgi:secretion/DNA translocation related TadE-like protein
VVMLGVIAAVLTLMVSGLLLASAVLASHRARAAADLAALAAAGVLMRGDPASLACESAAQVAAANHGRLQQCIASGTEVRLSVAVPAGVRGLGIATARSRAGPGVSRVSPVQGCAEPIGWTHRSCMVLPASSSKELMIAPDLRESPRLTTMPRAHICHRSLIEGRWCV